MKKSNTANRLKEYMLLKKCKQVDLLNMVLPWAKKYNVKINKSHISQYVSGNIEPKQDKIFILSRGLNVSEAWLMGYDVPMERDFVAQSDIQFLSPHELQVMQAYRNKPHIRPSVDKLLDIDRNDTNIIPLVSTPAKTDDIITFDDFDYAMYDENKELTEADKEMLLGMAKMLKERKDKEQ